MITARTWKIIGITFGIFGIVCIVMFAIYQFGILMSPGSYAFAEVYEMKAPESEVIEKIKQLKISNPELVNENYKTSEGRTDSSYWYYVYYFFKDKGQTLLTWTRSSENGTTELALVSVHEGVDSGWKNINKDFDKQESAQLKQQFEKRVLKPLGIPYSDTGK